tara:strand:+ start:154 stop:561 length:408 start_codon:yes stop_codon:yes gene_type:complete
MGKRRKRLTMAKYAKKYASIRKNFEKMKNLIDDIGDQKTMQAQEIKLANDIKDDIVSSVAEHINTEVETGNAQLKAETATLVKEAEQKIEQVKKAASKTTAAVKKLSATTKKTTAKKTTSKRKTTTRKKTASAKG